MENRQQVQSVVVAHQILEALSAHPDGLPLAGLARALAMTPSRILRHLVTLAELQLVERAGSEPMYRLGVELMRLGERAGVQHDINRVAHPALRDLNDLSGQATFLVRREGTRARVWLSFQSNDVPHLIMPPGMVISLAGSACGRVLLAFDPGEIAGLPLSGAAEAGFPDPMPNLKALERRLDQIRRQYFDSFGTDQANAVYSLAAPILDHRERAIAALGVVGFSAYYSSAANTLVSAVQKTAAAVSERLGSRTKWPAFA